MSRNSLSSLQKIDIGLAPCVSSYLKERESMVIE